MASETQSARCRPLIKLHRIVPVVPVRAGREDLDQIRMLDPAQGADLAGEPGFMPGDARAEQAFQGHFGPIEGCQGGKRPPWPPDRTR